MIIDKLAWIEIRDKKILSTKSYGKIKFYLPGGKREPGETDIEALTREIQEELMVHLEPESCVYIGTFEAQADSHAEGVLVKMTCYSANYKGTLQIDSEIENMEWLSYQDLDRVSEVDKLIFAYLKEKDLLD